MQEQIQIVSVIVIFIPIIYWAKMKLSRTEKMVFDEGDRATEISILLPMRNEKKNVIRKLKSMIEDSQSNLFRIIHYPPITGNESPSSIRAAAHEDINLLTVLVAGSQPGLQVLDMNGEWHEVSCNKNTIVVNSGDMLKMASGGHYPSTTHQVVNPDPSQNVSRFSMPLFLHPRDEVVLSNNHTAGSFLKERLEEIGLK